MSNAFVPVAQLGDRAPVSTGSSAWARDAYLRASAYYAAVLEAVDGVENGEAALKAAVTAHRACFDEHFEHRIAASVADPGVVDVSTSDVRLARRNPGLTRQRSECENIAT